MRKLFDGVTLALGRVSTVRLEDLKAEDGQGAVEYALVVLGVAGIMVLAVAGFTNYITTFMSDAGQALGNLVP